MTDDERVVSTSGRALEPLDHRPDLQWLRGAAVLVVLGYHFAVPGFAYGFVGVDVFFVISGYLITRLLLFELLTTARLRLSSFALRRVRRLLPMSATVFFATLGLLWFQSGVLRRHAEAPIARATAVFGANVGLARQQTDYLAAERVSAFQHYWSLAVEEQFYLLLPVTLLCLALLARAAGSSPLAWIGATLMALFLLSVLTQSTWMASSVSDAFFLLPARGWELLAGGLLALAEIRGHRPSSRLRSRLRLAGLVLIGLSVVGTLAMLAYPWPGVLAPVVGGAFIVWSGVRASVLPAWINSRQMLWFGDRSYSLYLWHWPVLVVLGANLGGWSEDPVQLGSMVLAVIALSAVSYRWIEEPSRHGRLLIRRSVGAVALVSTLVVSWLAADVILASGTFRATGPPVSPLVFADLEAAELRVPSELPSNLVPDVGALADDLPLIYDNGCHVGIRETAPPPMNACTSGSSSDGRTIALVGDSHAAQWFPGAQQAAGELGLALAVLTKSGCALHDSAPSWLDGPYSECVEWRRSVVARIGELEPSVILLGYSAPPSSRHQPQPWLAGTRRAIGWLRESSPSSRIVVLLDQARPEDDVPFCLSERSIAECAVAADASFDDVQRRLADDVDGVIDPSLLLCRDGECPAVIGDVLTYRDGHHLTSPLSNVLSAALRQELAGQLNL